jgi:hypothetical protein
MIPKTWFDEENKVLRIRFYEQWTEDDIPEFFSLIKRLLEGKEKRYVLADLSDAAPQHYSKEFRRVFAENVSRLEIQKAAMLGANPALKIMARVLLSVIKEKNMFEVRFFNKASEALEWLKE